MNGIRCQLGIVLRAEESLPSQSALVGQSLVSRTDSDYCNVSFHIRSLTMTCVLRDSVDVAVGSFGESITGKSCA